MRSMLKATILAFAMILTVSSGSAMAQAPAATKGWQPVAVQTLPRKVSTGYKRLFAHAKITKVEKSTTTGTTLYRVTTARKGQSKKVIFDAQGNVQR